MEEKKPAETPKVPEKKSKFGQSKFGAKKAPAGAPKKKKLW